MSDVLIAGLAIVFGIIFVLGVAINIHEFGHFLVARLLGMRVEAFSFFGIGPRIWGFKRGHTDYRVSAIPLGAYVKLYGDDVTAPLEGGSSEEEEVPKEELYELRPRWQKFLVMLGGPFMNIVLALAIPFGIAVAIGIPAVPSPVISYVAKGSAAEAAGIEAGDRIVEFDGIKDPTWNRIQTDTLLLAGKKTPLTVERKGEKIQLSVVPERVELDGNVMGDLGALPDTGAEPVIVDEIEEGKPAESSGLQKGDRITSVDGKAIRNGQEMKTFVNDAKGGALELSVTRGERDLKIETKTFKDENTGDYRIGIKFDRSTSLARDRIGIGAAAVYAFERNWSIMRLTGKAFGQMFAGERSVSEGGISGPIGIIEIIVKVATSFNIEALLILLMVISLNLGLFNLLPIPLLDGGQIAVLGIEAVLALFGLTLSMAVKEKIQLAGLGFILLLMIVVFYFDISRIVTRLFG
ncbi:MAG: RIP metalloprotease RseP [Acidobacteriota bacterium]|nr:RIP metalloprotease RseP [Acidobacteriota bacterium]MDH3530169.1 RIP metalloprotease RseP [Acidobacteriota bacterium]